MCTHSMSMMICPCFQVVASWVELVEENWADLLTDQAGSFFVRALARVLVGVPARLAHLKSVPEVLRKLDLRKKPTGWPRAELLKLFRRAFDFGSMHALLQLPAPSLVLQDLCALEPVVQSGLVQPFVTRFLADATESPAQSWCQPASSRLWEQLVRVLDDQLHESMFAAFLADDLEKLATHPLGNFPLKAFLQSVRSEEVVSVVQGGFCNHLNC